MTGFWSSKRNNNSKSQPVVNKKTVDIEKYKLNDLSMTFDRINGFIEKQNSVEISNETILEVNSDGPFVDSEFTVIEFDSDCILL